MKYYNYLAVNTLTAAVIQVTGTLLDDKEGSMSLW